MSVAPSAVARFNHKLDYWEMGTLSNCTASKAALGRLLSALPRSEVLYCYITEKLRGEKHKLHSLGSVGRLVREGNTPVQIQAGSILISN